MARKVKRIVLLMLSGVRYIRLRPLPRRPRVRRDPSRYWYRTGLRLSSAVEEYGHGAAK